MASTCDIGVVTNNQQKERETGGRRNEYQHLQTASNQQEGGSM
jgi:hypothetical protein